MDAETKLVIITFVFIGAMSLLIAAKAPKLSVINKDIRFDRTKMPVYIKFLVGVTVLSIGVGYIFTTGLLMISKYVGLNMFVGAILGANLILYRQKDKT